jgi:8-oxo-dGTP pyrophosphatase MutT (NUDIX family)
VYRLVYDRPSNSVRPEYLMVQRKDSLAYVEFIRGKYKLENVGYIQQLVSNMTREELECIENMEFQELWRRLWTYGSNKCYAKEQHESESKLSKLKEGYTLVDPVTKQGRKVHLDDLMKCIKGCLEETEWGWPKGRRNLMESDKSCATREFREETGIRPTNIRIRFDKPVEEVFMGSNQVRYKHVYYIAEYIPNKVPNPNELSQEITHGFQVSEIRSVRWFTYDEAQHKLRNCNIEKRELLKRVNNLILRRNICLDLPFSAPHSVQPIYNKPLVHAITSNAWTKEPSSATAH